MEEIDYSGYSANELRNLLRQRDRIAVTSRRFWIRAAKAAMAGDFRELRNRVELAESGPVTITNGDHEWHT